MQEVQNKPTLVVRPTPRVVAVLPVLDSAPFRPVGLSYQINDLFDIVNDEYNGETTTEDVEDYDYNSEGVFEYFPEEMWYDYPQQSANDQNLRVKRNYVKICPSLNLNGVIHDGEKAWKFNHLIAYVDLDQDMNMITKNFLDRIRIPFRFVKLDLVNRVIVSIELVINHEVFEAEFFVSDGPVHRKPVPMTGSRWRNIRHLRLAYKYGIHSNQYDAIVGYNFYKFISLNKNLVNDAGLVIEETKLGYIVSGRSKITDIPIQITSENNDNDSDVEEYDYNKPRGNAFISAETGSSFYPHDILNH